MGESWCGCSRGESSMMEGVVAVMGQKGKSSEPQEAGSKQV